MHPMSLGEPRYPSPYRLTVSEAERVAERIVADPASPIAEQQWFELAGPRPQLFFDPRRTRAGIVTCGGLCPGLNNVIRSLFFELREGYGVNEILGFRYGYRGLDPARGDPPLLLSPELVDRIHSHGGTMLGTSRGPVDTAVAVDNLIKRGVNILFTVGGDGTQRGAVALLDEARKRDYPLAVVGVPKTIDNDVPFVARTFGFLTAVEESARVLTCAHAEARSVRNGIALVKLMGRHAGFIAVGATVANQDVNFCLIPEVPFKLQGEGGFLGVLKRRIRSRAHAVIALAEGAGQDLIAGGGEARDASGNLKLKDIGSFLREQIEAYFRAEGIPIVLRYFDPSYIIRSVPVSAEDALLCDLFAREAVHAAMAGKTGIVIGLLHDHFIHVPIALLATQVKHVRVDSMSWRAAMAATRQPERFE